MKSLIVYDSAYGNTETVASAIRDVLGADGYAKILRADQTMYTDLENIDLLVIGTPTYGGRPTPKMLAFLNGIPEKALAGIKVSAFDTRLDAKTEKFFIKMLLGAIGYAAPKAMDILKAKGGTQAAEPTGFIVQGKEGPLRDGELERAKEWAGSIQK